MEWKCQVSKTVITSILARMVIVKCRPYGQDPSRKNREGLGVWASLDPRPFWPREPEGSGVQTRSEHGTIKVKCSWLYCQACDSYCKARVADRILSPGC